jgi:hypothetical protein
MHDEKEDAVLRDKIRITLSRGLRTTIEPIPKDNVEFDAILQQLHGLEAHQIEEKLTLSGFVDRPYGKDQQRCFDCMYYSVHRKWCVLPSIGLPVEPDWWCRLWRL